MNIFTFFVRFFLLVGLLTVAPSAVVPFCHAQQNLKKEELLNPFIRNFTPEEYGHSPQNWGITQDDRGMIYIVNNDGIIEYDGVRTRLITTQSGNALSSIGISPEKIIYVGAYDDLGYLKADSVGNYRFVSLLSGLKEEEKDFRVIRDIFFINKEVYFQGDNRLLIYNPKTRTFRSIGGDFHNAHLFKGELYVRDRNVGLTRWTGKHLSPVPGGERFREKPIYFFLPHESGKILTGTLDEGLLLYNGKEFFPFKTEADNYLHEKNIYCALLLKNGNYLIGTSKGGIVVISSKGKLLYIIDEQNGLTNNAVSGLFQDRIGNIWTALDNGFARIDGLMHVSYQNRVKNSKRSFFKLIRYKERLVANTDNGISKAIQVPSENGLTALKWEHVPELGSDCWDLLKFNDKLLVSSMVNGVSAYDLNTVVPIARQYLAFCMIRSKKDSSRIYLGLQDGIAALYFQNGNWIDEGKIKGVSTEIRSMVETPEGNLWLASFLQGAIYVDFKNGREHPSVKKYGQKEGLEELNDLGVYAQKNGQMVFYYSRGITKYNPKTDRFEKDNKLNSLSFPGVRGILNFAEGPSNSLWSVNFETGFPQDFVSALFPGKNGNKVIRNLFSRLPPTKMYYLLPEEDGIVWLAHESGIARLDLNIPQNNDFSFKTLIRRVIVNSKEVIFGGIVGNPIEALPYSKNSLRFEFAALSFDRSESNEYQYKLEGVEDDWSEWTKETQKDYTNLSEGSYRFRVRSRNIYGTIGEENNIEISVRPPWYRTWWAYLLYISFAGTGIYLFIKWRLGKLEEDKRKLEQIVEQRTAEVVLQAKELEIKNNEITQINEEVIQQRDEILAFNEQITQQKEEIEHQNMEILDSINYARRIQDSILPAPDEIRAALPQSFVLYRPKDVVSGDFFWFSERENLALIAAVDCTGHGIPGAFMSVMGSSLLNQIVNEKGLTDPGTILNTLNELVRSNLHQVDAKSASKDGMDLTLAVINYSERKIRFGGANNPMYYIPVGGELQEFKTNKYPIGGGQYEGRNFTTQELECAPGDMIYLFSDGYADQFGGPKRKKFMYGKFKKLLQELSPLEPEEQKTILDTTIQEWMNEGNIDQIDDILVIGIKF